MKKYKGKKFRKKSQKAKVLLEELAKALDKCHANKIPIEMRSGIVCSKYGYVLPVEHKWVVRMMIDLSHDVDDDEDFL